MKKCCKCNEIKDLALFHKRKSAKDGKSYHCVLCEKIRTRKKLIKNRDKANKQRREWKLKNKDKVSAQSKKYYKKNKEKINLRNRENYANKKDEYTKRVLKYRDNNPDYYIKQRLYQINNPKKRELRPLNTEPLNLKQPLTGVI